MEDNDEQGRRLRAVRIGLCRLDNRDEFALAVGKAAGRTGPIVGFGGGNVRETEGGRRGLRDHERAAVCKLAGLPETFFTVERAELGLTADAPAREANTDDRLTRIEQGVAGIAAALSSRRLALGPAPGEGERPDEIDRLLDRIGEQAPRRPREQGQGR